MNRELVERANNAVEAIAARLENVEIGEGSFHKQLWSTTLESCLIRDILKWGYQRPATLYMSVGTYGNKKTFRELKSLGGFDVDKIVRYIEQCIDHETQSREETRLREKIARDVRVVTCNPKIVLKEGTAHPTTRGSWPGLYGTVRVDISIETAPSGYEELVRELNALVEKHEGKLEILRKYNE